ncbi:MAG: ABC transporter permease [Chloroflexota bacterium]|nr:ABC transporter permease [Chloroflexota bacterium]MDE3193584.1 ABC transporter permease [Chloroflexota bacterium]
MTRVVYVLTAAWQGFTRSTYMTIASTLTVALMLLLFAFFVVTDRGLQSAVSLLESKVELVAYLSDDAKLSQILDLKTRIERDPAVARVDYVSKDDAMKRLKDLASDRPDIGPIADTGTNPLPASLEIKLASAQDSQRVAAELRAEIGSGAVTDVADNPQVVDKLLTITRVLSIGGLAVLGMMLFVALFVIVNTIRIAVHARRDEIEIMQLVGATDRLVAAPFVIEGMLVGLFGAAIALLALIAGAGPVTAALIQFLDILPVSLGPNFLAQLAGGVVAFALLMGAGGATISVRTHLAK